MRVIKRVSVIGCVMLLSLSVFGCKREAVGPPRMVKNNDSDFELSLASATFDYENAFTSRDSSAQYDENVYNIHLKDNNSTCDNPKTVIDKNIITVTNTGTYVISGELSDGQIVVDADSTDKIQLVLDNVSVRNSSTSAIKVLQAKKVFITLADNSSNNLSMPDEFVKTDSDKADGVIYSKKKLALNGNGKLTIDSPNGHGVVCNDDLIITNGEYEINAGQHAVKARDSICFAGGKLDLTCSEDAVHSDNDTDSAKGNIYIKNTDLSISAGDDAVHASGFIIIDDGNVNVTECYEGIEAQQIEINGGNINVKSSDDGINASSKQIDSDAPSEQQTQFDKANPFEGDESCYVYITGGNIIVDADGDGIDSNGYLMQSGGNVTVYGPENSGNAALDYNLQAKITGGTAVAFGFSGMAQGFNSYSAQGTMLIHFDSETSDSFVLTDSDDLEIISCDTNKKYNSVVVSTPDITVGNTYIAKSGEQTKTIKLTEISYADQSVPENNDRRNGGPENFPPDMRDKNGMKKPPEENSTTDLK